MQSQLKSLECMIFILCLQALIIVEWFQMKSKMQMCLKSLQVSNKS